MVHTFERRRKHRNGEHHNVETSFRTSLAGPAPPSSNRGSSTLTIATLFVHCQHFFQLISQEGVSSQIAHFKTNRRSNSEDVQLRFIPTANI